MNIKELAFQNVRGNWRSYKMFFLSSCFSVFAFYMYMSIMFHPQMNTEEAFYGGIAGGLYICSIIILGFSSIFILYASSVFIDSRKKEFGLYILMGATKQHITLMMMIEQIVIGLSATFVGIVIGTMFLKLFFMIFSLLLNFPTSMPFIFNVKAIFLSLGIYGLLFSLLSIYNAQMVWKFDIIQLLKGIERKKKEPKSSFLLALLGIFCLGVGYAFTFQATLHTLILYFPVVTALTAIGTYFACRHGTIWLLNCMKKWKRVMYQYPYLFVINQLLYRMKDNRRFFFILSMATTFVVTATGVVYLYILGMKLMLSHDQSHTFSYVEKGLYSGEVMEKGAVEKLFKKHGVEEYRYVTFTGLPANIKLDKERHVSIISEKEYNEEAAMQGRQQFHPEEGSAMYVYSSVYPKGNEYKHSHLSFDLPRETFEFVYNGAFEESTFNSNMHDRAGDFLVVNERDFERFAANVPMNERYVYHGYVLDQWQDREALGKELTTYVLNDNYGLVRNNIFIYKVIQDTGALVLFVGSFISILFFLASCSITYFKWFNSMEYDRKQYESLSKMGMTKKEARRVLYWQLAIPFFFPVVLGCFHSGVALHTFTRVMLEKTLLVEIVSILAIYFVGCIIYFFFAQREYMKYIK
ncbi:ABC transporter permease [Priestia taiwanensis]|uniref:ABC transporter permease n=1 Tax=Priestia taiwanensis TaxID=1347902 RepID=A0A917AWC8_9BACI|nr:ABC transporter permease [Priestia taiwanensis]MBM7363623.1 putative ABC transport system permease protein [Priestia taiwanensis]GGE75508.1 ABC transporter permease [Priestia taiwanensis]